MENKNVILLVVENRDHITTEYAKFLVTQAWTRRVDQIQFWDEGKWRPVWYMRREMIKKALETSATHILFVDSDVIPPLGYLDKLLAHDVPIVSGVYLNNNRESVNRKDGAPYYQTEGISEMDVISMGLSLIKREVFEKIEYPEPDIITKLDADVEFCREAKKAGYTLLTDFSVRGAHLLIGQF